MQRARVERLGQLGVREPQGRCRVAASTSEPGRDRDALLDSYAPARLHSCGHGEGLQGAPHDRVLGEALDRELVGGLEHDVVVDLHALEHREDLVLTVAANRSDDEAEVDLGVGARVHYPRCFPSSTNSSGSSSSARARVGCPIAVRPSSTRER